MRSKNCPAVDQAQADWSPSCKWPAASAGRVGRCGPDHCLQPLSALGPHARYLLMRLSVMLACSTCQSPRAPPPSPWSSSVTALAAHGRPTPPYVQNSLLRCFCSACRQPVLAGCAQQLWTFRATPQHSAHRTASSQFVQRLAQPGGTGSGTDLAPEGLHVLSPSCRAM